MKTLEDVINDDMDGEGQLGSMEEMMELKEEMDTLMEYASNEVENNPEEKSRTVATNTTR